MDRAHRCTPADLSKDHPSSSIVLDVSALASQLRLGDLSGPVRIKGKSMAAEPWRRNPTICFGTLAEGKAKIRYRVPTSSMPRHGEDVVIVGTLCLSPLTFELQLHGDVEGAWQPKNRMPRLTIPKRSQAPQPLAQFLEHHPVTAIGFIVTETGWSDVERSAGRYVSCCVRVTPNFGDEDELVAAIEQLGGSVGIEAIVLARGGGAMLDEVGNSDKAAVTLIGQNMPFYAALGHSNDLMLLDKYADESFGTPSDFGHSLRSALERAEEIEASRRRLIKVVDENERLRAGIAYRDNGIAEAAKHAASLQEELASAAQARSVRDRAIRWLIGSLVSVIVIMLLLLKVFTHSR